jgi:Ribonuclease G/E
VLHVCASHASESSGRCFAVCQQSPESNSRVMHAYTHCGRLCSMSALSCDFQLYTPQFNAFACNFGAGSKRHGVLAASHASAKAAARKRDEEALEAFRRKLKVSAELSALPRGGSGHSLASDSAFVSAMTSLQPPSPRNGGSSKSALVLRQRYHKQHVGVADGPGIATAALALARSAVVRRALTQVRSEREGAAAKGVVVPVDMRERNARPDTP